VVEESDGRPGAVEMEKAVAAGWMVKQAAKNETLVIALRQTLDNGEAEAIALARFQRKSPFLRRRLRFTVRGGLGAGETLVCLR